MENIKWEQAINTRRSVRSFEKRPVEDQTMASVKDFIADMKLPFEHHVHIRFFKADPNRRLANNLKNPPPDNAAFITTTDLVSISKAGFVGEMFILYATSIGLATCWYGHYSLAELERVMPHLGADADLPKPSWGYGKGVVQGERAVCITPLGYWEKDGLRLMDRMTKSMMSYKRKPLSTFLDGDINEASLPPALLYAFDLARKAPSAANSQFWRFTVAPDFKTVSIALPVGYKHFKWRHPDVDIGACACHFWLGLTLKGVECDVLLTQEEGRAVWRFKL